MSVDVAAAPRSLPAQVQSEHAPGKFWVLTLGSIGVVYGDIGTSPLYALRESVVAAVGKEGIVTEPIVLGILSLMLWSLLIVVTLKYVVVLLHADNNGEGGTLALMALAQRAVSRNLFIIVLLGSISAALFYGDAVITPALSVLSAIEGLKIATPAFEPYVVPLTVAILCALFAVQSHGTARVAAFFGPITMLWFVAIAAAGVWHVISNPRILLALNPVYGIEFLAGHGMIGLITLGAVFLTVTGAEALYADLGHFGRKPIQTAWLAIVLPALALNYLGQGVLVLADPKAIENPFFLLYPNWALLPMVALATAATVIASQAVITGAYSLTRQAIQLGLLPRLEIRHTSEEMAGQIYMPKVNTLLLVGVLALVILFKSSSALASAYGIAVTGTMVVTGVLAFIVIWKVWQWSPWAAGALIVPFLLIDLTFLTANLLKVVDGGWLPLGLGACIVVVMLTWRRGTRILLHKNSAPGDIAGRSCKDARTQAPAAGARHRSLPHQRSQERSDRAVAQSQALQGAAREERDLDGANHGHTPGIGKRTGSHRADQQHVFPYRHPLRIYGRSEHTGRSRPCAQTGVDVRYHVDFILPVTARAQGRPAFRDATLAG